MKYHMHIRWYVEIKFRFFIYEGLRHNMIDPLVGFTTKTVLTHCKIKRSILNIAFLGTPIFLYFSFVLRFSFYWYKRFMWERPSSFIYWLLGLGYCFCYTFFLPDFSRDILFYRTDGTTAVFIFLHITYFNGNTSVKFFHDIIKWRVTNRDYNVTTNVFRNTWYGGHEKSR